MRKFYFTLLFAILGCLHTFGQTQTLPYTTGAGTTSTDFYSVGCQATIDYLSSCQQSVSATFTSSNYEYGNWTNGNFDYYVNGVKRGSGSGTQTIDLSQYIPITSVKISKTNNTNWNQVNLVVNVTSPTSSMPASGPTVSNVEYCKNATAVPLTATLSGTGTTLKWYTSDAQGNDQGIGYSATAFTPSTATVGKTTYWVAQANSNGCESVRNKIDVTIKEIPLAPAVSNVNYGQGLAASPLTATGTGLMWYTSANGTGSAVAPTPNTETLGTTTYWVSQTVNGCESPKAEIKVTIVPVKILPYKATKSAASYENNVVVELGNFTTCQNGISATFSANTVGYSNTNFDYYVNGVKKGTASGTQTIDLKDYLPVNSVKIVYNDYNYGVKNVSIQVNVTSLASLVSAGPAVTNVEYCKNSPASALKATVSGTGKTLKWYTSENGENYSSSAPIPSTETPGTFSYWVSQATDGGCESERTKLDVLVKDTSAPAPIVNSNVAYNQGVSASSLTAEGTQLKWFTEINGNGSSNAPIPSTNKAGNKTYWVTQTIDGCESPKAQIQVTVNKILTLPYTKGAGTEAWNWETKGCEATIDYLTTCQQSVSATLWSGSYSDGTWSNGNFEYYVNGNLIGTGSGEMTVNLTQYIPIASVRIKKLENANWNQVNIVVNVTSIEASMPEASPTVANITYCKDAVATALTATASGTGQTMKWYTSDGEGADQGINFTSTAFTPTTDKVGTTNYWVAQATANGCESARSEIQVTVKENDLDAKITYDYDHNKLTVAEEGATYQWYSCEGVDDYVKIEGATSQSYVATEIGLYSVVVSSNGCTKRSDCELILELSTPNSQWSNGVKLYPNPTTDNVVVELPTFDNSVKLEVYDISGRLVLASDLLNSSNSVNLSELTAGVYMFRISSENGMITKKLLKK